MHPFALSRADDPATAIAAHARDPGLAFIAGGTDLIGLMKDRAALPERLLDINDLPGMARIEALPDGGLRIGALARMSDVAADLEVRRRFPVIAEALLFAASGQLRNMASIGGNLMQRTRCAYSATRMISPATSGGRAPAARPATASIATTQSSDGPMPASPRTHPMWRWRLRHWTRRSWCAGPRANDRFRSPISIASPAIRRNVTTRSVEAT
jgi:CO/xanthine dehydrogenase FAD-binding subunit